MKFFPHGFLVIAGLMVCEVGKISAATLVDSGLDGSDFSGIDIGGKALAFTMGSTSYKLENAAVRLYYESPGPLPIAPSLTIGLYSSVVVDGNLRIGNALTYFAPPVVTAGRNNYTLTPGSQITLQADTTYWFVMYNLTDTDLSSSTAAMGWTYNTENVLLAHGVTLPDVDIATGSQIGRFPTVGNSISNPSSWTGSSSVFNDLQLNVTVLAAMVPEPTRSLLVMTAFAAWMLRRSRPKGRPVGRDEESVKVR